ncbi:MAG TPA: hypothetical protein VEC04_00165 [Brevundimonas sp.]|nr:hypothetical protein [Brevundimonas sp.]HYC73234.1 hypothetical protein [Brevundimonas sp.]
MPARSHGPAETELEGHEQPGQHPAVHAQHQTDAERHHPDAERRDWAGRLFPGVAQPVTEAGTRRARLVKPLVAVEAVPADGRAADENRGTGFQAGDQAADGAGDSQARTQDAAAPGQRPGTVADRFAGKINHGVDTGVRGDLAEVRDERDRDGQIGGPGISHKGDDLVPGPNQRRHEPATDESGGSGDENPVAPGQFPAQGGGVRRDQPVGPAAGQQIAKAEDEYGSGRSGGHQTPKSVRRRNQLRGPGRPAGQQRQEQHQDGAIVQGQQGMGDPFRGRKPPGAIFLDEIRQGNEHFDGEDDHQGHRQPAPRFGPSDQGEEGGVDQVANAVQAQLPFLGRFPRQPFGQLVMEQGVEGPHGDLERHKGPEQVGHRLFVPENGVLAEQAAEQRVIQREGEGEAALAQIAMGDDEGAGFGPAWQAETEAEDGGEIEGAAEGKGAVSGHNGQGHADASADMLLESGRAGEALGAVDHLRKAGRADVQSGPDLALADGVLGDGDDAGAGAKDQRQRSADQAGGLGETSAGEIALDGADLAPIGDRRAGPEAFAEPAANRRREGRPVAGGDKGAEAEVGEFAGRRQGGFPVFDREHGAHGPLLLITCPPV